MLKTSFAASIAFGLTMSAPALAGSNPLKYEVPTEAQSKLCGEKSSGFIFVEAYTRQGEIEPTFKMLDCHFNVIAEGRCKGAGWIYSDELRSAKTNPGNATIQRNLKEFATALTFCPNA